MQPFQIVTTPPSLVANDSIENNLVINITNKTDTTYYFKGPTKDGPYSYIEISAPIGPSASDLTSVSNASTMNAAIAIEDATSWKLDAATPTVQGNTASWKITPVNP